VTVLSPDIADWSPIPGSNALVDGTSATNVAEGNLPSTVNNAVRAVQSGLTVFHRRVFFFDDFLAGALDAKLSSTAGGGTGNEALTVVANSTNGTATLKSASDVSSHATQASTVTLDQLNFRADQGGMAMEVRLKIDVITNVALFVGFTDVISTTVELPVFKASASDDLDSDADNACGVGFDTQGTTDQWWHGGVKATADTAATHSGSAPVADTYYTIRVEVSAAGAVRGFINDVAIGAAVSNAVTITTSLTPCVMIANRDTAQRIATIDYLFAQQSRE
jgi:hypothetical protein